MCLVLCGFIGGFIFKTCHSEGRQVIRGARLFLGSAVPGWLTALGSEHVRNTKAASVLRAAELGVLRSWEPGTGREQGTAGKRSCSGQGKGLRAVRRLLWAPQCQGRGGEAATAEAGMETGEVLRIIPWLLQVSALGF